MSAADVLIPGAPAQAAQAVPPAGPETPHPAETKYDQDVRSFRRVQGFPVPAAGTKAASPANHGVRPGATAV
jgi:hypothetical protein